ncbi:metal ABC transporter ATP-binding protein [Oculatella sp. LEGE 06141]|uniref:metal ABC transporter ATP-binding protein n=1 Tax=Oculatella sp. LEGE 06141 TaxID=1828648 RepID=UPI001881DFB7|nr:metal ABC transporter ATP-binding protein [Oculatella sp. LEGE 06141]MBE9180404.1 metal ABC transporter ATP-binding protein [Oculatella sp. LEGE 06141]
MDLPINAFTSAYEINIDVPARLERAIAIQHLGVQYRSVQALRDITLTLEPGRLVGVIGPNGAGKSTLLQAMLGLVPVTHGSVNYHGKPLASQLDKIAYVPQRSQVDWTYPATVWDVVMMGRIRQAGWFRSFSASSRRTAEAALERVGMSAYRDRPIGQLSGGQQQRVFLARALTQQAEIYCFDEPFIGIDQRTEAVMFEVFRELADAEKHVMVVNHDLGDAIAHFDDLILLNTELIASGTRRQVLTRDHLYAAYGGKVAFFSGEAA